MRLTIWTIVTVVMVGGAVMPAAANNEDSKMLGLAAQVEEVRELFDKAESCRRAARPRPGHHFTHAGTSFAERGREICGTQMRRAIVAFNEAVENRLERRIRTAARSRIGDAIAQHALSRMPQCSWYPTWVRWGTRGGIRTGHMAFMPMVEVPSRTQPPRRRRDPSRRAGGPAGR